MKIRKKSVKKDMFHCSMISRPWISPKSHGVCPERPRLQHRSQVQGQGHLDAVPVPRQVPELQEMTVQKGAGTPQLILGTGENRGFSMQDGAPQL